MAFKSQNLSPFVYEPLFDASNFKIMNKFFAINFDTKMKKQCVKLFRQIQFEFLKVDGNIDK